MSRMATMQVLNQSFRNLNDALNAYMENRNRSRYMDLQEQAQQLEAARNEDLDRRRLMLESARMGSEYSPEVGNAYRYAAGGDPIAQNLFMQGVGKAVKQREAAAKMNALYSDFNRYIDNERAHRYEMEKMKQKAAYDRELQMLKLDSDNMRLNRQFENQKSLAELNNAAKAQEGKLNRENQFNIANAKMDYQKMLAELAQKQAAEKARQIAEDRELKNAMPYITAAMETSTNSNPYDMAKAVEEYKQMRALVNSKEKPQATNKGGEGKVGNAFNKLLGR